jgi:hypothetical protein
MLCQPAKTTRSTQTRLVRHALCTLAKGVTAWAAPVGASQVAWSAWSDDSGEIAIGGAERDERSDEEID